MEIFSNLLLLGRPAAGKSEFVDFMKKTPDEERVQKFHIGRFEELDDFVWIWEKFTEDNLWEEMGYKRIYSHRENDNYGLEPEAGKLLDFMLARFNKEYRERYLPRPQFYNEGTLFVEFSRGMDYGYRKSFRGLSDDILSKASILYIKVNYEESWRRNVARYQENLKHSVLAHMATRKVMEHFYREDDWGELTGGKDNGFLEVNGNRVPFVTMDNEPELTERGPLSKRYGAALTRLMELKRQLQQGRENGGPIVRQPNAHRQGRQWQV